MRRFIIGLSVVLAVCLARASQGATLIGDFETGQLGAWIAGSPGNGSVLTFSTIGATSGAYSLKVTMTTSWTNPLAFNLNSSPAVLAAFRSCDRVMMDITRIASDPGWAGKTNSTWRLRVNTDTPNGGWQEVPLTGAVDQTNWNPSDGDKTIRAVWDISAYIAKVGATFGWLELFFTGVWDGGGSGGVYYIDNVMLLAPGEPVPSIASANHNVAAGPTPAQGAANVARDGTVLSWVPGAYAKTHNVYFGTDFSDVNAAGPGSLLLVSQGQDANSYSLPRLALGQIYFWRVDEVNAPPTPAVYKGSVWSFTAEPIGYPMTNVKATASSQYSADNGPGKTVDGSGLDVSDSHGTVSTDMWLTAKNPAAPIWIQYEFDRLYKLHEMWVWNYNYTSEPLLKFGVNSATVQYSSDAVNWTTLGDSTFNEAPGAAGYVHNTTVSFGGVAAKYVKILVNSGWGTRGQYGLSEVRFYYIPVQAMSPTPASGTAGLSPGLTLTWQPGREAGSHKIFLGTDPNVVAAATVPVATVNQNSYSPSGLGLGTTYYWKVNEVNLAATPTTWEGSVWSFSTKEYLTVDDMESYNDGSNQIFNVWVDGYGTTTNGSQVGYATSANGTFGETTIVHGGKQSMPFGYSNKGTIADSEATRTFDTVQDWSAGGADTLSLYVRGVPTNFVETNGTILMNGTGTDIWDVADQFHFAYKQLTGDGTIIAKVESVDVTNAWSKAGVMIRSTLDAGSMNATNVVSGSSGISFQYRTANGGTSLNTAATPTSLRAPYWVKLARSGNTFTAQCSPDGVTWTNITVTPAVTITMPTNVFIGLAVTSHQAGAVCAARFSNVSTTGTVAGQWTLADIGAAQPAGNGLDTLYLAVEDNAAHRKAVTADPYVIVTGAWQQWKIPLSTFSSAGVKLNSVKKITIGVGDKTKAPSGAAGILYIDDIMFGHPAQ